MFVKYIREVASGRRKNVNLSHILVFVTGCSEEPTLGFAVKPNIEFVSSSLEIIFPDRVLLLCFFAASQLLFSENLIIMGMLI